MSWLWLLFLPAIAYQLLALFAITRFVLQRRPQSPFQPPISVLKPVLGFDPNTYSAFRSQIQQNYPEFEILFAVRDPNDPVMAAIRQLQSEFPDKSIRIIHSNTNVPNGKVGSLIDLAREARHPIWVINDADIEVTPSYLSTVVAPLEDPEIGVVTCPYRANAHSTATRWEAMGIATDFMPSTMVAQTLGMRDFGLGSTLAFRARDLQAAGGFEVLANYIADDFQLAHRVTKNGGRALLSRYVVETSLGESTWAGMWHHQLRWARTIRRSKGAGYAGLPIAQAGLWVVVAAVVGIWPIAAILFCLRVLTALMAMLSLNAAENLAVTLLAPLWDLFAFTIWIGAWSGNTVRWRNRTLRLNSDGTIDLNGAAPG